MHGELFVRVFGRWGLGAMQFKQGVWMWKSQRARRTRKVVGRRENGGLDLASLGVAYLQDQKLIAPPLVALVLLIMVIFFPH